MVYIYHEKSSNHICVKVNDWFIKYNYCLAFSKTNRGDAYDFWGK